MMTNLEMLARGCFTARSTLVSETFALNVYAVLKDKGCLTKGSSGDIDALTFKAKLKSGDVDLDMLNQCLTTDPEFGVDGGGVTGDEF